MKKLSLILAAVFLLSMAVSIPVCADNDAFVIPFAAEEDYIGTVNLNALGISSEDGATVFTFTGDEHPLFWFALGTADYKCENTLNLAEYPFMKIMYDASGTYDDYLRLYWGVYPTYPGEHPGPNFDGRSIDFEITRDGWTEAVYNCSELYGDWTGYVSALRYDIDPISQNLVEADETFKLKYIAFFKTADAANAFSFDAYLNGGAETEAPVTDAPATDAPVTEAPSTDAPKDNPTTADLIGVAAAAVIVLAGAAVVFAKKRVK